MGAYSDASKRVKELAYQHVPPRPAKDHIEGHDGCFGSLLGLDEVVSEDQTEGHGEEDFPVAPFEDVAAGAEAEDEEGDGQRLCSESVTRALSVREGGGCSLEGLCRRYRNS